jgi:glycerophosphoryl diester phosphodiesterase
MVKQTLLLGTLLIAMLEMKAQTTFPVFDKEGHRGCRGLMPENTIPAMKKAIDVGVTTLEMDVVITKDKQVVLSHDAYINPLFSLTPDGKEFTAEGTASYMIYKMDYAEVKKFDVGSKAILTFRASRK